MAIINNLPVGGSSSFDTNEIALCKTVKGNYITLDESISAPMVSSTFYGKTSQKQYSGKNLWTHNHKEEIISNDEPVKVTYNGDGSISIVGMFYEATTLELSFFYENDIPLQPNTDYILNYISTNKNSQVEVSVRDLDWSITGDFVDICSTTAPLVDSEPFSFLETSVDHISLAIHVEPEVEYNETIYPMIRLATVQDNSYEKYVGGQPSPNLKYPQEIEGIGNFNIVYDSDIFSFKFVEKNLWGGKAMQQSFEDSYSTTVRVPTETEIMFANNTNYNNKKMRKLFSNFKENTQYTFILVGEISDAWNGNIEPPIFSTHLSIVYTDGIKKDIYTEDVGKFNLCIVSELGKTIESLEYNDIEQDTVSLYIKQSGIFEGVITEDEFEPYIDNDMKTDVLVNNILYNDDYIKYNADGTGKARQTKQKRTFNGALNEEWNITVSEGANLAYIELMDMKTFTNGNYNDIIKCDKFMPAAVNGLYEDNLNKFSITSGRSFNIILPPDTFEDIETFRTWLSENPITIVYELRDAIEKDLTAEQIVAFKKIYSPEVALQVLYEGECEFTYFKNNENSKVIVDSIKQLSSELEENKNELESKAILEDDFLFKKITETTLSQTLSLSEFPDIIDMAEGSFTPPGSNTSIYYYFIIESNRDVIARCRKVGEVLSNTGSIYFRTPEEEDKINEYMNTIYPETNIPMINPVVKQVCYGNGIILAAGDGMRTEIDHANTENALLKYFDLTASPQIMTSIDLKISDIKINYFDGKFYVFGISKTEEAIKGFYSEDCVNWEEINCDAINKYIAKVIEIYKVYDSDFSIYTFVSNTEKIQAIKLECDNNKMYVITSFWTDGVKIYELNQDTYTLKKIVDSNDFSYAPSNSPYVYCDECVIYNDCIAMGDGEGLFITNDRFKTWTYINQRKEESEFPLQDMFTTIGYTTAKIWTDIENSYTETYFYVANSESESPIQIFIADGKHSVVTTDSGKRYKIIKSKGSGRSIYIKDNNNICYTLKINTMERKNGLDILKDLYYNS